MTEVLDVNINTQENINVYLPEEVSCGTIEAYFGESAELTLDVSLKYIKSGQQAIQDYVNTQINPTFYKYIDEAKEAAKNADADADNAAESAGLAYQSEVKAKESELNAKTSENNAKTSELNAKNSESKVSQDATSASESAYNAQQSALAAYEYASNADEDAKNALETLGHVLESQEKVSQSELKAKASEEKSKASEVNAKTSETNAKASENKATQEANASAESAYQSQQSALASYEYASNAEADAQNANEALEHTLESEERARIWADGNDTEVKPLGGTHSSMVSAGLSYAYANAEEDVPVEEWATTHDLIVQGEKGDKGEPGETPDISNLATKLELEEKQNKEKYLSIVDNVAFDLEKNVNYTAEELTSLEFHLPALLTYDFICSLAFSSGATPTQLIVIDDIKWTGDDIVDGAFVPIANKRYNVIIWWDGMFTNGAVRGV